VAMDDRMAAEVIDLFVDEVVEPEALRPSLDASMQRLTSTNPPIDRVLTHFQVSPHPSLVVAVEGATEMYIVPRVMKQLGMRIDPAFVRVVNFKGVGNDLTTLAKYAAEPVLGPDAGGYVLLDRPVTRFLVLVDQEGKFTTEEDRAHQRKLLLDDISEALPEDLRPDLYDRDSRIVEIVTWGKYPWEFAHFTDKQLADSILQLVQRPYPGGRDKLVESISLQRSFSSSPDIEEVWKRSGVSKTKLAAVLWPVLETRIEKAIVSGVRRPPVMDAVYQAFDLANLSHGQTMSLRRHSGETMKT
jgi:hypothetical protein